MVGCVPWLCLPHDPSGKIQKYKLREAFAASQPSPGRH
jgi:hypothetical protein